MKSRWANRVHRFLRVWVDALSYAIFVALLGLIVSFSLGIALGGGFVMGNIALFILAWVVMAYATFHLWPRSPEEVTTHPDNGSYHEPILAAEDETTFQRVVKTVPPNRWVASPRPHRKISIPGKLFLASLFMLLTSFILETQFGIG